MNTSSILSTVLLAITLVLIATTSLHAASNGEVLFEEKCASCHTMTRPQDMSTMLAPPLKGLMYHMSENFKNKEEIVQHINSFVMNPTEEKAVCRSVRRFGLMPSQKGLLSEAQLNSIAQWMIEVSSKQCEAKTSR